MTMLRDARNDPSRFSLKNGLTPACNVPSLPSRSVLFCTDHTLGEAVADATYLSADGVHLTTAGHRLVAGAVLRALDRVVKVKLKEAGFAMPAIVEEVVR